MSPNLEDSLLALQCARATLSPISLARASRGGALAIGPSGALDFGLAVSAALALLHDDEASQD